MVLIEIILFTYLGLSVLYVLFLSIAGKFYRPDSLEKKGHLNRIVVLVPCYKEDSVILGSAKNLSELQYPRDAFDIVVIADSLKPQTLEALSHLPVITMPVTFDKSTKTKSLNVALNNLSKTYDIAIINDADNIVKPDFLQRVNEAYNAGHQVIQTQRVAKNLNTPFAFLDAANEIINNHLFRKAPGALGLSASLIGSGMAFRFDLLKEELAKINATGGFDKVLQLQIMERGLKIYYHEGVLVFDEKVDSPEAFKHQRRRWLSSHFIYARLYFLKGIKLLFKGNVSYFFHGVLTNLFPPRILLLFFLFAFSVVFSLIFFFFSNDVIVTRWWALMLVYGIALLIPIPISFYSKDMVRAILHLPTAIIKMLEALFNLKGADKKFIHTKHTHVDVDPRVYNKLQD